MAFRSGLIGDMFGVHSAGYTSQPIFAPPDEDGTKLLAPGQNSIGVLGQVYGRVQIGDQEIRGWSPTGRYAPHQPARQSHGAEHV